MFGFKLMRAYVLNAKVPVATINGIVAGLDADKDGNISVMEFIEGVKKAL